MSSNSSKMNVVHLQYLEPIKQITEKILYSEDPRTDNLN